MDVPHKKLIVIDGLLAFKGSANLTQTAWRSAEQGMDIIEVVSNISEVSRLHNRTLLRAPAPAPAGPSGSVSHACPYLRVLAVGPLAEDFRHQGFEPGVDAQLFPIKLTLFPIKLALFPIKLALFAVELLLPLGHEHELVRRLIQLDHQRGKAAHEVIKGVVIHSLPFCRISA